MKTQETLEFRRIVMASGPRKRYLEQSVPFHLITIMSEDTIWVYSPEKLIYHQRRFESNPEPTEITAIERMASRDTTNARFLNDERLRIDAQIYVCTVVATTYQMNSRTPQVTVRFYIDRGQRLRRIVESGGTEVIATTIVDPEWDARISEAQFQFVPPSNAKRVARFE